MAALEQVMQMRNQGMTDDQITGTLQQQGISPEEITNALSQAQIKNAVADPGNPAETPATAAAPAAGGYAAPATQEMTAPATQTQDAYGQAAPAADPYAAQGQAGGYDAYGQQAAPAADPYAQGQAAGYDAYGQQAAGGYDPYAAQGQPVGGVNTDTIIEVSEQVFSEKIQKIQKQIDSLNEFKTLAQTKIDNHEERLKRIESMIDGLQISILEKVGSYGKSLEQNKKEMAMMQDSFGKLVNPITKKATAKPTATKKTPVKTAVKK